jgi:NAD(P)-dependent dehydrogenase (short-subunit alcohol dehydrogenase family)
MNTERVRRLRDKVTILTGGSGGIGKGIAAAFAREGSHLVLSSRTASDLEAVRQELQDTTNARIEVLTADNSKPDHVKRLINYTLEEFATIDILVNCAGIYGPIGLVNEIDTEKWLEAVHINLYGTFLCIRAVLPTMINKKKGKIINLSGGGATSPFPRFSAYSASKAAVVRLTETIAQEVSEYHIDINAIAPGAVNTRFLDQALAAGEAAGKDFLVKSIKQKQEGGVPPARVAELAVFLASSSSDGLTGRLISLLWDNWPDIPQHLDEIMSSDIYALRRIIPEDRGQNW